MEQSLRNRLTYGPLMIAALLGMLYLDWWLEKTLRIGGVRPRGVGILILLLLILPPAVYELANLFAAERVQPYRSIASLGCAALVVHAFLTQFRLFEPIAASSLAFIIVFVMLFAALRRAFMRQTQEAIHHMAGTVLATLYLGGLAWFLMALRVKHAGQHLFHGSTMILVMILIVVKFTDIGAYFGGRALGKHKLIPWLSPKKTWEGLACGLLTAGIAGAICASWIHDFFWPKGFIFGVVIGAIGQAGDLLESMLKRDA